MKLKIDPRPGPIVAPFLHSPHLCWVSVILTLWLPAARTYKRSAGASGKSLQSTGVLSVSSVPNKSKAPKVRLSEQQRGPDHSSEPARRHDRVVFFFIYLFLGIFFYGRAKASSAWWNGLTWAEPHPRRVLEISHTSQKFAIYFNTIWNVFIIYIFFNLLFYK